MRPHLFYACFVVSRIAITCYIICHGWRTCVRQVVLDKWLPLSITDAWYHIKRRAKATAFFSCLVGLGAARDTARPATGDCSVQGHSAERSSGRETSTPSLLLLLLSLTINYISCTSLLKHRRHLAVWHSGQDAIRANTAGRQISQTCVCSMGGE